jgi:hypothetical protein
MFYSEDNPFYLEEQSSNNVSITAAFKLTAVLTDQPKYMQNNVQFKGLSMSSDEVLKTTSILFAPILKELREGTLNE